MRPAAVPPADTLPRCDGMGAAVDLRAAVARIREARRRVPAARAVLVALSGIDGCGKGYVASRMAAALEAGGLRTAVFDIDDWLNLPHLRFDPWRPAAHFYEHAIRFDAMFARLVLPLRDRRSVRLVADHAENTAPAHLPRIYEFRDVDIIVLEGIFLLKRPFRPLYDLSLWIDCTFETALERAIARGQEGLPPAATVRVYQAIYFPAQRIHMERDDPRGAADLVIANDPTLAAGTIGPLPNPDGAGSIESGAAPNYAGAPVHRVPVIARNEGERGAMR